jgi:hypothetical protein
MLQLAVFGITNDALNLAVKIVLLFLVVIWAALIFWTYADARRRLDDPMLIACATAASLFPFVGTIVYTIVRPPEFLDDVRLRELEMHAAELRLHGSDWELCPHCDHEIKADFLRCPHCQRRVKEPCPTCAKPLEPHWSLCPYCETQLTQAPPPSQTARRRRRTQETAAVDYPQ